MAIPTAAAIHHTAFLVRDLETTAQRLSDTLGVGPWNVFTIAPAECLVRGEPSPFTFRAALATVGGGTFELITPHTGRSIYDEHLEKFGDGFHHTCLVVSFCIWTFQSCRRPTPSLVEFDHVNLT